MFSNIIQTLNIKNIINLQPYRNNLKVNLNMISREEAIELLKENIKSENMLKHSFAAEAVLRGNLLC